MTKYKKSHHDDLSVLGPGTLSAMYSQASEGVGRGRQVQIWFLPKKLQYTFRNTSSELYGKSDDRNF